MTNINTQLDPRTKIVKRYHNTLPFSCSYQLCFFDNMITEYPLLRKISHRGVTRHFHIPCAMMLRLI